MLWRQQAPRVEALEKLDPNFTPNTHASPTLAHNDLDEPIFATPRLYCFAEK